MTKKTKYNQKSLGNSDFKGYYDFITEADERLDDSDFEKYLKWG